MSQAESQIGHHYNGTRAAVQRKEGGAEIVTTPLVGDGAAMGTEAIPTMLASDQKQLADEISKLVEDR